MQSTMPKREEFSSAPPAGVPESPPKHSAGKAPSVPQIKEYTVDLTMQTFDGRIKRRVKVDAPCGSKAKQIAKRGREWPVTNAEVV